MYALKLSKVGLSNVTYFFDFSWNVALWSVYGIKTPFIILILFMAIVMIISVLPSWSFGEKKSSKPPVSNSKWFDIHGKME